MIHREDELEVQGEEIKSDADAVVNIEKISRINATLNLILTIILVALIAFWFKEVLKIGDTVNVMERHKANRGDLSNITEVMEEIQSIYETEYIGEKLTPEEIEDIALWAFTLAHQDKYGNYMSPSDSITMNEDRYEKLVGIGIEVVYEEDKGYYIAQIHDDSPAKESGLQVGSYITSANGIDITEENKDDIISNIKGAEGTEATIGITQDNEEKAYEVERREIRAKSVSSKLIGDTQGIKYIQIKSFTQYTDEEFIAEIEQSKKSGIDKFIIDLRGNPGGEAETVIKMIDYVVPEGIITRFEYADTSRNEEYNSDKKELTAEIVVLVNEMTASASELFSKTLQEYGKATIIGEKTFGKGTVLTTYALSNGGALSLSTAKYYTKSGEEIEGIGVIPDISVSLPIEKKLILYKLDIDEDDQIQKALEILGN